MNLVGGRPREEEVFSWAVGPAQVREELREQGTRNEDLVSIVSHKTKFDKRLRSEDERSRYEIDKAKRRRAKYIRNLSSQLYRFLIRQVRQAIKKRRRTKSIRGRQTKRRRTKYKEKPDQKKVKKDPGKWGIFFRN